MKTIVPLACMLLLRPLWGAQAAGFYIPVNRQIVYHLACTDSDRTYLASIHPGTPAPEYILQTTLQGTCTVACLQQQKGSALLCITIHADAFFFRVNGRDIADQSALCTQIQHPFLVRMQQNGTFHTLWLSSGQKLAGQLLQRMLGEMEVVFPSARGIPQRWGAQEQDAFGKYKALYIKQAGHSQHTLITKTRTFYYPQQTQSSSIEKAVSTVCLPAGHAVIRLFRHSGQLWSLHAADQINEMLNGRKIAASTYTLHMQYTAENQLSAPQQRRILVYAARLTRSAPFTLWQNQAYLAERNLQKTALGNSTLQSLTHMLAGIANIPPQKVPRQERSMLFRKFRALIVLHPSESPAIAMLIIQSPSDGAALSILADACLAAGTPQAQAALAAAVRADMHHNNALALLIPALGMSPAPDRQTISLIQSLAFNAPSQLARQTAQLLLGVLAHTLQHKQPLLAKKLTLLLLNRLVTSTKEEKEQFLFALGNTGMPMVLPHIAHFISTPDAQVRATAVFALRRIRTSAAELLLQRALHDSSSQVRYEAVTVAGSRPANKTTINLLCQQLHSEQDAAVQKQILADLSAWRKQSSVSLAALHWAASYAASESVRRYAHTLF